MEKPKKTHIIQGNFNTLVLFFKHLIEKMIICYTFCKLLNFYIPICRVMMTEAYNLGDKIAEYYGKPSSIVDQIGSISHMPLYFDMITKFKPSGEADSFDKKSGSEIVELVSKRIVK